MKLKPLKIGKLQLENNLILAPMVDVTDLPYRLLCRRAGAGLAYTEMIYIEAILHDNVKTKNLMKTAKEDRPLGLQITGNSEEEFEKFVDSKKWKNFDLIDLNCGCPSLRITGNEAGSFLLKNPEKIARMVKILKKTKKPVSVKIRLGFKKNNVLETAKEIEKAGADALTVHARLATDGRDVPADWKWIKKVKENSKIPIIGNGDIFSGELAEKIFRETNCDGIMIARGAIGDPLIFSRILKYFEEVDDFGEGASPPTLRRDEKLLSNPKRLIDSEKLSLNHFKENLKIFKEYLRFEKKYYGSEVDTGRIKYVCGKFLRGFDGAGKAREKLMRCKSFSDIEFFANTLK